MYSEERAWMMALQVSGMMSDNDEDGIRVRSSMVV
jgi:hypothetical protein